jgi:hypothetical protein
MRFDETTAAATLGLLATIAGCDGSDATDVVDGPQLDTADTGDSADQSCQVVLHEITNLHVDDTVNGKLAYEQECERLAGKPACGYAWNGTIDVATDAIDDPDQVRVLYRADWDSQWNEVRVHRQPVKVTPEFTRFAFGFFYDTTTSIGSIKIQVVPFLATGKGRAFDHNRNPGVRDNYVLAQANVWSIDEDLAACPARHESNAPARVSCDSLDPASDAVIDLTRVGGNQFEAFVHMTKPEALDAQFVAEARFTGNAWLFAASPDKAEPFQLLTFGPGNGGNVQVFDDGRQVLDLDDIDCRF